MLYQKKYRRFVIEAEITKVYNNELLRLDSLINNSILMGEKSCVFYVLSEHIKLKKYYNPIVMGKKIYEYLYIHGYQFAFIKPFKFSILLD